MDVFIPVAVVAFPMILATSYEMDDSVGAYAVFGQNLMRKLDSTFLKQRELTLEAILTLEV